MCNSNTGDRGDKSIRDPRWTISIVLETIYVLNSLKGELPQSPVLGQLCTKQSHQARARGAGSAQTPQEHFHTSASCDSHSQQLQNTLGTPQITNAAGHSFPHRAARSRSVLTRHSGHELAQFSQVHYRKLLQLLPTRKC